MNFDDVIKALVPVVKAVRLHNDKIEQHESVLNYDALQLDILGIVLDAFGVPADNSREQAERFGLEEANSREDTYSRDHFFDKFESIRFNTDEDIWRFLKSVQKEVEST